MGQIQNTIDKANALLSFREHPNISTILIIIIHVPVVQWITLLASKYNKIRETEIRDTIKLVLNDVVKDF